MVESILSILYAAAGSLGFGLVFNLRGRQLVMAAFGGALAWLAYLLGTGLGNDLVQYFLATLVLSGYAEWMARVLKTPVIVFQIVALMPFVPGSGIYQTMLYSINGDIPAFLETGLHTLAIAGSLAIGVLLVSSLVRLFSQIRLAV